MRTRIVRIGNSRGVRLPKALIDQAGLGPDVELEVRGGSIVISGSTSARTDWARAAARLAARERGQEPATYLAGRFDDEEWVW